MANPEKIIGKRMALKPFGAGIASSDRDFVQARKLFKSTGQAEKNWGSFYAAFKTIKRRARRKLGRSQKA